MGVDFYACHYCGDTFPDCGEYVSCGCGMNWCSEECAEEEGYVPEHCKKYNVYGYDDLENERGIKNCNYDNCDECSEYVQESCNYCRNEDYEDSELLDKALELLNITREELIGIMKREQK